MLARTGITLGGFYFIGRDSWERWLLSLLGFVLARFVVKCMTRPPAERDKTRAPDTSYAP